MEKVLNNETTLTRKETCNIEKLRNGAKIKQNIFMKRQGNKRS